MFFLVIIGIAFTIKKKSAFSLYSDNQRVFLVQNSIPYNFVVVQNLRTMHGSVAAGKEKCFFLELPKLCVIVKTSQFCIDFNSPLHFFKYPLHFFIYPLYCLYMAFK